MRQLQLLPLWVLAGCWAGNDEEGSEDVFVFSSFESSTVTVFVVDEAGAPLPGISVSVEDVWMELNHASERGHEVYLSGLTDASGVFTGEARVPAGVISVDVIVHDDSGRAGPWTDTATRTLLGEVAPSSRQTVSVAQAINLNVPLEDVPE